MSPSRDLEIPAPCSAVASAMRYPTLPESLPSCEIRDGEYVARFARTRQELDAALKLRFEVFNLELGEGLDSSYRFGRDMDEFDPFCHHLIVETRDGEVVGTYRMQTGEMAASGRGFYSATEFDLSRLPAEVPAMSVELGRACVAKSHRNLRVLFLLWKGLAAYAAHNRKRYLFGCCSLTSQDPREGLRVMRVLEGNGSYHSTLRVLPRAGLECRAAGPVDDQEAAIPKLFQIYLRYGARVCGPPAIDRLFKTIDFLVLFDVFTMDAQTLEAFFGPAPAYE